MRLLVGLLVATLATSCLADYRPSPPAPEDDESQFAYQEKSFRRSLDECAEYLQVPLEAVDILVAKRFSTNDHNLKCVVRCAGINAGWWNDTTGIQGPVIESYFRPGADDSYYARRTRECLEAREPLCQGDCSRAYEAFLCYYHQYGNLKCSEEYIPLPELEAIQAAIDCINILRVPRELIEQYSVGKVPAVPETQCLYRCQYLAEGLYDPKYGFNLTRFYIRNHDQPAPEFLSKDVRVCTDLALRDSCDECARVYRARHCFKGFSSPNFDADIFQQAAQIILDQQAGPDNGVRPRYNSVLVGPHHEPCDHPHPHPRPHPQPRPYPPGPRKGCIYNCKN